MVDTANHLTLHTFFVNTPPIRIYISAASYAGDEKTKRSPLGPPVLGWKGNSV